MKAMRIVALAEATSFLALLVATYVKRMGSGDEIGVQILGPIHGLLFLAYIAIAFRAREEADWSGATTFWVLAGAVVPFGGYVVDWWLVREAGRGAA